MCLQFKSKEWYRKTQTYCNNHLLKLPMLSDLSTTTTSDCKFGSWYCFQEWNLLLPKAITLHRGATTHHFGLKQESCGWVSKETGILTLASGTFWWRLSSWWKLCPQSLVAWCEPCFGHGSFGFSWPTQRKTWMETPGWLVLALVLHTAMS